MKNKIIKHKKVTRRNKRKKHKNKTMIGGRPKINFPYTYFYIDYNTFTKYFSILNPYLNGQTNACNDIALGIDPVFNTYSKSPFLSNLDEICILVLKYDNALQLNHNNNLLNDLNFLNKVLGHAKIINYPTLKTLGVYNVCLHRFNITINQQGFTLSQQKTIKTGYGSVLFNCIYTCILLTMKFTTIWLGIDINNVEFEKIAWLYTSKGFRDPIFSNFSPDGQILPLYFIQLTSNGTYINNSNQANNTYNETIDLYEQIKQQPEAIKGIFRLEFGFDKSAILSLRLMPFLSFSEFKKVEGIEDFSKQRETSGRFLIYDSYINEVNNVGYILSLETNNEYSLKYIVGQKTSVNMPEERGSFLFHTHPFVNYKNFNVLIGPPSGQDIQSFLYSILNNIDKPMVNLPQFAAVISIEGIYIFSLSINGITNMINGRYPNLNDVKNRYEYPFSERNYNWETYFDEPINIDENAVKIAVEKYLNWFNTINSQLGNYFDIIFKPWKNLDKDTSFHIYYYNRNRLKIGNLTSAEMEIIKDDKK